MSETVVDLREFGMSKGHPVPRELGASWKAVRAWLRSGPLVLVQVERGDMETVKARLDLHKRVFIDPTPFDSSGPLVDSLVKLLGTSRRP